MLRNIRKRIIMLGNRMPFAPEKQRYFEDVEKLEWIHNNMILEGSCLTKGQTEDIMNGEIPQNISIEEPMMIERLGALFDEMYFLAGKNIAPELKMVAFFNQMLTGDSIDEPFRKISIILPQWDYVALHPAEIPEKMAQLDQLFTLAKGTEAATEECFEIAEKIHNAIIEIVPYGKKDGLLARVISSYFLMEKGYPAVVPKAKEQDYNQMVEKALKSGEIQGLKEMLKKEILDYLDLMIQLTAY